MWISPGMYSGAGYVLGADGHWRLLEVQLDLEKAIIGQHGIRRVGFFFYNIGTLLMVYLD